MSDQSTYNDKVVRQFAVMTIVWGIVGFAVGVLIAAQLAWPALNFDLPWLTLWSPAAIAYQCGYLCFRWLGPVCDFFLYRATHLPCAFIR